MDIFFFFFIRRFVQIEGRQCEVSEFVFTRDSAVCEHN